MRTPDTRYYVCGRAKVRWVVRIVGWLWVVVSIALILAAIAHASNHVYWEFGRRQASSMRSARRAVVTGPNRKLNSSPRALDPLDLRAPASMFGAKRRQPFPRTMRQRSQISPPAKRPGE